MDKRHGGIHIEKVVAFIHDNCKNIDNAGKALESKYGWFSLSCAGHSKQWLRDNSNECCSAALSLTTHFILSLLYEY